MPPHQADAILAPLGYAGTGDAAHRLRRLQQEFAAVLGVERVHVRHQGDAHFITGEPDATLLVPNGGPHAGRPRYRWADRGDGVSLGRRIDHD